MADSNESTEISTVNDINGIGTTLNHSGDSVAGTNGAGGGIPQPQPQEQEGVSLPPSKRRKYSGKGEDINIAGHLLSLSQSNNGEVAAVEDLDDRKLPAKRAASGGGSKSEPGDGEDEDGSSMPNDDFPGDGPRESSKRKHNDIDDHNELPLAPSLDEYLKSGGHSQYAPRPEWYHFSNEAAVPAAMRFAESPSSTARSPSFAFGRAEPFAAAAEGLASRIRIARGGPAVAAAVGGDNRMVIHEDDNNDERERAVDPPSALDAAREIQRRNNEHLHRRNCHEHYFRLRGGDERRLMDEPHHAGGEVAVEHQPSFPPAAVGRRHGLEGIPPMAVPEGRRAVDREVANHGNEGEDQGRVPMDGFDFSANVGRRQVLDARSLLNVALDPAVANDLLPSFMRRHQHQEGSSAEDPPSAVRGRLRPLLAGASAADLDLFQRESEAIESIVNENMARLRGSVDGATNNNNASLLSEEGNVQGFLERRAPNAADCQVYQREIGALERAAIENMAGLHGSIDGVQHDSMQQGSIGSPNKSPSSFSRKASVFGFDCDSALHLAIKQHATEAALDLIRSGACINFPNAKGITPLMIASQEGTLEVVWALLNKGALPNATTVKGSTALIQACHFGKLPVVEQLLQSGALVDQANLKNTTALMRASQEGHEGVVRLLLSYNAGVNRRNDERMTALMLSSQRGHASIVKMLVNKDAHVDAKTAQDSTSLMLACKRKNIDVAKIIVASGCELKLKDCKNRTVLETASRRGNAEFMKILTDDAQVKLMQEDSRRYARNFSMVRVWKLLQSERATIKLGGIDVTIHTVAEKMNTPIFRHVCPSKRALVRAMTLPAPLIELISSFLPLPLILEKRLILLSSRSHVDPDTAVYNALDLIDEVLEVGGILEAFDAAGVTPPSSFGSWLAYRTWYGKCDVVLSRCAGLHVTNIFMQESDTGMEIVESNGTPANNLRLIESSQSQRRSCNYLGVLARAPQSLTSILSSHPYDMPDALLEKLKTCHDIQSVVRRFTGGGIHFDTSIATEMVVMARMAVMWCESRPHY